MHVFKLFKSKAKVALSKDDINTLNKIDLAYMQAFSIKSIDGLRGMLAPACLDKISCAVYTLNNRYFADDKFRHTEWDLISVHEHFYTIKKQVTYDKIRINAAMSINAASNYCEQWLISKKDKIVVMDIEPWRVA